MAGSSRRLPLFDRNHSTTTSDSLDFLNGYPKRPQGLASYVTALSAWIGAFPHLGLERDPKVTPHVRGTIASAVGASCGGDPFMDLTNRSLVSGCSFVSGETSRCCTMVIATGAGANRKAPVTRRENRYVGVCVVRADIQTARLTRQIGAAGGVAYCNAALAVKHSSVKVASLGLSNNACVLDVQGAVPALPDMNVRWETRALTRCSSTQKTCSNMTMYK
ncbi:hypothetical protein GE09DRAFT_32558 [Coniochaeta sp. 2T2.1]|nr:hypothetical protein GE09DRAFT_32558 [Coniochaeta sp. 2T2.1]